MATKQIHRVHGVNYARVFYCLFLLFAVLWTIEALQGFGFWAFIANAIKSMFYGAS